VANTPTNETVLTHPFKDKVPIDDFFEGEIVTVNSFCSRTESLAVRNAVRNDPDKFKGDMLELLVEYMMRTMSHDNRIGIYDYEPTPKNDDVGVDGKGKGENGFPATVQVKFRQGNWVLENNKDSLSNFLSSSVFDHGVRTEDDKNMLLITTGKRPWEDTLARMLKGKVRVLDRVALQEMLDGRTEWWKRFEAAIRNSRVQRKAYSLPKLREHQKEGVEAAMASCRKGMIILPTGTGKTFVEAEIACRIIQEERTKGNLSPIVKFNSPRILLNFQLFDEVFKYLQGKGVEARYIQFCSGNFDDQEYAKEQSKPRDIVSTLSLEEVGKIYANAQGEDLPLIVFSTYDSSVKFSESGLGPCVTIHDEAHNLVSSEFVEAEKHPAKVPSSADFFFTATTKVTDTADDLGMNNPDIFGKEIMGKSPAEMISKGEMAPPRIHIVRTKNKSVVEDGDYDSLVKAIEQAFLRHRRAIHAVSSDANRIGAKVLVVCRGQAELRGIFGSKEIKEFEARNPDIHVFALSTDFGTYVDGERMDGFVSNSKKQELLEKAKALGPAGQCLIFHVDMLGEGIDIPGITGVMPFRNCEMIKFCQNIGRASRLNKEDKEAFYSEKITVADRGGKSNKWIKPCSWIIIPAFLANSQGFEGRFKEIIDRLRKDYDCKPTQHTVIDVVRGLGEKTPIDTDNEKDEGFRSTCSGNMEFVHELEETEEGVEKVLAEEAMIEEEKRADEQINSMLVLSSGAIPALVAPVLPIAGPTTRPQNITADLEPLSPSEAVAMMRKSKEKNPKLGRTPPKVTNPAEIKAVWEAYRGNGGTLNYGQIEDDPRFNLRRANGNTAWRICRKYSLTLNKIGN